MEQPNYYAIIPANVRYDNDLKANEKLMYGEITSLSNKHGYCNASNKYFANLYGKDIDTVSDWINNLKKKGYVKIEVLRKGKKITERRIEVSVKIPIGYR